MKFIVKSFFVFLGILLLGFGFLQTSPGKKWLVARISKTLTQKEGRLAKVHLQGLKGFVPFRMSLKTLEISDKKGPWLQTQDVRLKLKAQSLLRGTLELSALNVKKIHVMRTPESLQGTGEVNAEAPESLPSFVPKVQVRSFNFREILLAPEFMGTPGTFNLKGGAFAFNPHTQRIFLKTPYEGGVFQGEISGNVKGEGTLEAMTLQGSLKGKNLKVNQLSMETLEGEADLKDWPRALQGQVQFRVISEGKAGQIKGEFLSREGQIDLKNLTLLALGVDLKGHLVLDLETTLGTGSFEGKVHDFSSLSRLLGIPIMGQATLNLGLSRDAAAQHMMLKIQGSQLKSESWRVNEVNLDLNLKNIWEKISGKAKLSLEENTVYGVDIKEIQGNAAFEKGEVQFTLGGTRDDGALIFKGQGNLQKDLEKIKILSGKGTYLEKPFSLQNPVTVTHQGDTWSISPAELVYEKIRLKGEGRVMGDQTEFSLEGKADLEALANSFPFMDDILKGNLGFSLKGRGALDKPKIEGVATLTEGFYGNLEYGAVLKDVNVRVENEAERWVIKEFRATDGQKGSFSGSGSYDAKTGGVRVQGTLQDFVLTNSPELQMKGEGKLALEGPPENLLLKGNVKIQPVHYELPANFDTSVATLKVIEVRETPLKPPAQKEKKPAKLKFDLKVEAPKQVFIRGRGLDSEWKGKFEVTGSLAKPILSGRLKLIRGMFSVIGKTIEIEDGEITFGGEPSNNPEFFIKGIHKAQDLNVIILISGDGANPKIELTSDPSLPDDEILSRFLFGKDVGNISLLQSLQLANAARTLQGKSPSQSIFGSFRSALGVDSLGIKNGGDLTTGSLSTGKYITDKVHINLDQGVKTEDTKVVVEIDITDNITVETEAGTSSAGGIGVHYKWDY